MFTVKLNKEQRRLMLHALATASQLQTGLTGSDYEAMKELHKDVANTEDDELPEWQRRRK